MLNRVYRIYAPRNIKIDIIEESLGKNDIIVKPLYLSICAADIRYYTGSRDLAVLNKKFPMALIHECVGEVIYDPKKKLKVGSKVVMIPNTPTEKNKVIKENYLRTSKFKSSGYDGFMQEFVLIDRTRVIEYKNIQDQIAVLTELLSIAMNAIDAFEKRSHEIKNTLGVWGNGSVGFVVALLLKHLYPKSKIIIFGTTEKKLDYFSFADEKYLISNIPEGLTVDHAFECVGKDKSQDAINQIIDYINPQGVISLLGVSENRIPINTRMVLEKGLTLTGNSRSGYDDFYKCIKILETSPEVSNYLQTIINDIVDVHNINDIKNAFELSVNNHFKTIMKWDV